MDIRNNDPNLRRIHDARDGSHPRIAAHRIKQHRLEEAAGAAPEARPNAPQRREPAGLDRLDLSESARAAARFSADGGTSPDRLAALRELYQSGRLNSPERMERAADEILGKRPESPLG